MIILEYIFRETGWEDVCWINFVQDRIQWASLWTWWRMCEFWKLCSMTISLQVVMVSCPSLNAYLTNSNVFQVVHIGHKPSHKARGLVVQWWVLGQKIFRHSWHFLNISPALVTSGISIIHGLWNSVKYPPLWTGKLSVLLILCCSCISVLCVEKSTNVGWQNHYKTFLGRDIN